MSAITGIFYRDGRSVPSEQIERMNDRLSHRGPDGSRVWFDGPIALGHQMLHTTYESLNEELPFKDPDSGLVITSDARIDNRAELAPLLGLKNVKNIPDSLFILKAYQKWGVKCPEKLLGDFAFAIRDPEKESLFCARDHMGVKPFYYYLSEDIFAFSTEIKALFAISDIPNKVNELKLAFHIMDIREKKLTFYEKIFSLTASNSLMVNSNQNQIKRYWELDPNSEIIMDSEKNYVDAFRDLFGESVKCRLRSALPIGFELSGGLDSSSIVSFAKKILNENNNNPSTVLNTFSFVFDNFTKCDERYFIKKIVDTGSIEPHFILGDNVSPLDGIETILWHLEQPFFNPNIAMLWKLYEEMRVRNTRVLLSGHDGDSVISYGQNYLKELAVSFKWKKLIYELKETSNLNKNSFLNTCLGQVVFPLIPKALKKLTRSHRIRRKPDSFILNKKFKSRINADELLNDLYFNPFEKANTSKKFHYYLISKFAHQYTLEFIDKSVAAFSIEPRYPFFDKRLIEFCYALPTEMKFKNGWRRYILRIAMEGILPKENQWRLRKPDLNPIFQKNLLLYEKKDITNLLHNKLIEDYVDVEKLEVVFNNYKFNIEKQNFHADSFDVWFVLLVSLWLQKNNK